MNGILVKIISPGTFGLVPDTHSRTDRVWLPAGTILLKTGKGSSSTLSILMFDGRFFEVPNKSFMHVDAPDDYLDTID